jgi:SAM-dependent methyltransferase
MKADVQAFAEHLPFAEKSFDVVACRAAVHHFADVAAGVREMARVAADRVLIADNLFMGEAAEEAELLRDPTHVRNYSEAEWRTLLEGAGLQVEEARTLVHPIDVAHWLERVGSTGEDADRVRELLADRIEDGQVGLDRIVLRAVKS